MTDATGTALRLERTFDADPQAVFDAWTHPDVLRRWWAAGPDWDTPEVDVDLRVGGRYRLAMRDPSTGGVYAVAGEYIDVDPPRRLAYTWAWEGLGAPESRVSVEFHAVTGGGTRVVVTHHGLAPDGTGPESRTGHEQGWTGCLDNLERRVFA